MISKLLGLYSNKGKQIADKRIKLTKEIIDGIKTIKMNSWE